MRILWVLLAMCVCAFLQAAESKLDSANPNQSRIYEYITQSYQEKYKDFDFEIQSIVIQPLINTDINNTNILKLEMGKNTLLRHSGTLIGIIQKDTSQVSIPIQYKIQATLQILRSKQVIKSNQDITALNASKERISVEDLKSFPLAPKELNKVSAKSLIAANTIITIDKIQHQILVRKNESFTGIIKEGSIQIETSLQALENGTQGQIIKALNQESQKVLRVRIIDSKRGEVL